MISLSAFMLAKKRKKFFFSEINAIYNALPIAFKNLDGK